MRTFLLLSILSGQGMQTIAAVPERLLEVNREIEALGGRVVDQWALLGAYDFLSIVEATDEFAMATITAELGARGSVQFETLPALTLDELADAMKGRPEAP
ncbi:MAG: GYD domain-containing protein [Miltoncostaeaceae bacterium]